MKRQYRFSDSIIVVTLPELFSCTDWTDDEVDILAGLEPGQAYKPPDFEVTVTRVT